MLAITGLLPPLLIVRIAAALYHRFLSRDCLCARM